MTGYLNSPITFGATTLTPARSDGTFIAHLTAGLTWQWAKRIECPATEAIFDHAVDATGNTYLTGVFEGNMQVGAATLSSFSLSLDLFVAKIDPQGQWQWAKQVGGYGSEIGSSIRVDNAGSVYVGGMFTDSISGRFPLVTVGSTDGMVLRFDTNGTQQAAMAFGGIGEDQVNALAFSPSSGHLMVGGIFNSPTLTIDATHTFTHTGSSSTYSSFITDTFSRLLSTPTDAAALAALTLSPNPAHGAVWLNLPAALPHPTATGTLLDGVGRVVRSVSLTGERTRLDINGLAPGLYTVRVGELTRRVVVE